jgi:hypothetical protein
MILFKSTKQRIRRRAVVAQVLEVQEDSAFFSGQQIWIAHWKDNPGENLY